MDTHIYSIGKKRRRRKERRLSPFFRFLLIFLALTLCLLLFLNFKLTPDLAAIAEASARNRIVRVINEAVSSALNRLEYSYEDLIRLSFKADGSVAALSAQLTRLSDLRTEITRDILGEIRDTGLLQIDVPLGNLLGLEMLSGRGPKIQVDLLIAEGFSSYMESHLTSAGINQTLHSVVFKINVTVDLLIPSHHTRFVIAETYPVAETILLGEVPEAYTEIHRLTDEITEEDIDDIFDFGAERR